MLAASTVDAEHLRLVRQLRLTSALVVPLIGRSGPFGAIAMFYDELSGRRYHLDDLTFAEDVARRAAHAVDNARLFHVQTGRLAAVRRVAEAAQHAILPPVPQRVGPLQLTAAYVSAAEEAQVGGDLYEVVHHGDAVRLLVGDVRGKGLEAVRLATVVLGEFRAAAAALDMISEVAVQMDTRLADYLDEEDFMTALLAEIREDGHCALVRCGHPPAMLARDGGVSEMTGPATVPLGLGVAPPVIETQLKPGDRLLLYTDGLIEARSADGRFVDPRSVIAPLASGPLSDVLETLLAALHEAIGGELDDDLALLAAEYRPEGAAPSG
jgi:serine phosphatase RsbU (regulator of sigma subunit)